MRWVVGAILLTTALGIASGCGDQPPEPADPARAREALENALTAWKEGKSADSLKSSQPPIEVSDHQWSDGVRLVRYQLEGAERSSGADHVFTVTLWIENARRKSVAEHTEYFVGTSPTLRIIRSGL